MKKECLEIYIHIPFCVKKCHYCDFLSGPATEECMNRYVSSLCDELVYRSQEAAGYVVDTVFFGGGTPSILSVEAIAGIMQTLQECYELLPTAEITIEANPGTVTSEKVSNYRKYGINRISFGLQSAQAEELTLLGRIHSYETFVESFQQAREAGFDNINIDLMCGLPGQKKEKMQDTLQRVLALAPEHISVYSLIVEEGTVIADWIGQGKIKELSEEEDREMYDMTRKLLAEKGYERYEISNYAKPGRECKHNLGYWNRKNYLGFGIGAASLFQEQRFSNTTDLEGYIKHPGDCRENLQELSMAEQMEEFMFLGLRKCAGVSQSEFYKKFGRTIEAVYGPVIAKHSEEGLLSVNKERIFLTDMGLDLSNYVMADFLKPEIP